MFLLLGISQRVAIAMLVAVGRAVVVAVTVIGIEAGKELVVVVEAILIGIIIARLRQVTEVLHLPLIRQAVVIGVGVVGLDRRAGRSIHHGGSIAQRSAVGEVNQPILVRQRDEVLNMPGRASGPGAIIEAVVSQQPNIIDGRVYHHSGGYLDHGKGIGPDAHFVNQTDEAIDIGTGSVLRPAYARSHRSASVQGT